MDPATIKPVSYWSYGLYTRCPKSYDLIVRQHLKTEDFITHPRTVLGSLVHWVMERALDIKSPLFKQWETALHQAVGEISKKADPKMVHREMKRARVGIEWLVASLTPLLTDQNKFHTEITLKGPYSPAEIELKGRIDLVIEEPTQIRIYDHKGVSKVHSLTQEQMWFYQKIVQATFNKPLFEVGYLWFTEKQVRIFHPATIEAAMETNLKAMKKGVLEGNFPAKLGRHCNWCDVKDKCQEYKEMVSASGTGA